LHVFARNRSSERAASPVRVLRARENSSDASLRDINYGPQATVAFNECVPGLGFY